MGVCHGRQGKQEVGTVPPLGRQSIMSTDEKHKILPDELGFANDLGELIGTHTFTGWIEENLSRARVFRKQVES